jgi:hypothetical protein
MGKSSTSAPAPDPQIGSAALKQAQTGEDWLNFAKTSYAQSMDRQKGVDALTTKVTEQQLGLATDQANWSKEDRQRYKDVYQPIENDYIKEATNYATEARQDEAAAEARAGVQTAAANARTAAERQAASMGIDPSSGRYAGVQATTDMNQTLAEAGAANTARQTMRDKGLALKADVANMGKGYASSAGTAAAGSVNASGTALSGNQASNAQALAASTVMNQGFSGAMQGYGGQADTLNRQYGLQLQGWQAQQQANASASSGLFGGLGTVAGALIMSDEDVKENFEEIPEGKALDAVNNMPVSEWDYQPGVADEGRHIGTMAQDFQRETGRGDGKSIPVVDAIGVTMKAVQDLSAKFDQLEGQIGLGMSEKAPQSRKTSVPLVPRRNKQADQQRGQ